MSHSLFNQSDASILLESLRSVFEEMFCSCSSSDADFSVVEEAVGKAVSRVRSESITRGLSASLKCCPRDYVCPCCGTPLTGWGHRPRRIVTSQGEADILIPRYRCRPCSADYSPVLEGNSLVTTQFTLCAKERIVHEASEDPYASVSRKLPELGISVSAKEVDRVTREASEWQRLEQNAETQWYVDDKRRRAKETFITDEATLDDLSSAAQAVQPEGLFRWEGWEGQEWAQISVDGAKARSPEKGPKGLIWFDVRSGLIAPVDKDSQATTFHTAGVMNWDDMFDRLSAVWSQRPIWVKKLVFISDDGAGILSRAESDFPDAVIMLDIYHASEHVGSAADAIWGEGSDQARQIKAQDRGLLMEPYGAHRVIRQCIAGLRDPNTINREQLLIEFRYLLRNRHRMRYAASHAQGLPVGSGAMESAIKQVCVERLRKPGMMWTREGAKCILGVRSACLSGTMNRVFQRKHDRARHAFHRFLRPSEYRIAI